MAKPEQQLQIMVCDFMRYQFPEVVFRSDFSAGMKLTLGQATRQKRLQQSSAYPDMFFAAPRPMMKAGFSGKYWHGMFLELKPAGSKLKKLNGEWASPHIAKQAEMLEKLNALGYFAEFGVGFEQCTTLIKKYMNNEN